MTALATDDLLARLKPLCLDEDDDDIKPKYLGLKAPFAYTRADGRYAVATDGHLAVLIAYDGELLDAPVDFEPIFARYQPSDLRVDTAALLAFTGPPEYHWRHEDCDDCQGHWPDIRKGLIGDVLCDLNLLARGLSVVPAGVCELSLPADYVEWNEGRISGDVAPIFLCGNGWWIVLMPMRGGGEENLPRFEVAESANAPQTG